MDNSVQAGGSDQPARSQGRRHQEGNKRGNRGGGRRNNRRVRSDFDQNSSFKSSMFLLVYRENLEVRHRDPCFRQAILFQEQKPRTGLNTFHKTTIPKTSTTRTNIIILSNITKGNIMATMKQCYIKPTISLRCPSSIMSLLQIRGRLSIETEAATVAIVEAEAVEEGDLVELEPEAVVVLQTLLTMPISAFVTG